MALVAMVSMADSGSSLCVMYTLDARDRENGECEVHKDGYMFNTVVYTEGI